MAECKSLSQDKSKTMDWHPEIEQKRSCRRMLLQLERSLKRPDLHRLAFAYLQDLPQGEIDTLKFFKDLLEKGHIQYNSKSSLEALVKSLEGIERSDLVAHVEDYISEWEGKGLPRVKVHEPLSDGAPILSTEACAEDNNIVSSSEDRQHSMKACLEAMDKVAITGIKKSGQIKDNYPGHFPRGKKRKIDSGALDELDLQCDQPGASDESSDKELPLEFSEQDRKFMRMAQDESKKSPDDKVQVGAILVDPETHTVIGKGHNRMPVGCEDKFPWSDDVSDKLKSKYPFVFHAVKAAIKDAYQSEGKNSIEGSVLYTTLFPANTDAQWIVECGIKEMVYVNNTYRKRTFSKAAKQILAGINCRKMSIASSQL